MKYRLSDFEVRRRKSTFRLWSGVPYTTSATGMIENLVLRNDLWYEAGSINCSMLPLTGSLNKTLIAFNMHESGPMFWKGAIQPLHGTVEQMWQLKLRMIFYECSIFNRNKGIVFKFSRISSVYILNKYDFWENLNKKNNL